MRNRILLVLACGSLLASRSAGDGVVSMIAALTARPLIASFTPTSGHPGTSVLIRGENFFEVSGVQFDGARAVFTVISSTRIAATVPADATTGPIQVISSGGSGSSSGIFTVAPRVSGFTPSFGAPGATIVIAGANLTGAMAVQFNGKSAAFRVTAPTQISAVVPPGATSGPISVTTPVGSASSTNVFQAIGSGPLITDFSPAHGPAGTPVVIFGVNFTGATQVAFNGSNATFTVTAPTQISAVVPRGASSGLITVRTASGLAASLSPFLVVGTEPLITGFAPSQGAPGTPVVISGLNFRGATAVKFNGTNAQFNVTAPTQISAIVPTSASSGAISVVTPAGAGWSTNPFVVLGPAPLIIDFAPASGHQGTIITINGANFKQTISVRFNQTNAPFTVTAPTQIRATVPFGSSTGPIQVTTPSGSATSGNVFVVTGPGPIILQFSPTSGAPRTPVTIDGANFTGATNVFFNNAPTAFSVTAPTQIRALVPTNATTGLISVATPAGMVSSSDFFFVTPSLLGFTPATGTAGSSVSVSGVNFTGASAVHFGDAGASFQEWSGKQIDAIVPRQALSGTISVTTPAGIVASTNPFLVLPVITAFEPLAGLPGSRVKISGAGFHEARQVSFNGASSSFAVVSRTQIEAIVPFAASSGPIRVVTAAGLAASLNHFIVADPGDLLAALTIRLLASENKVIISWPASAVPFELEIATNLPPLGSWTRVSGAAEQTGSQFSLTNQLGGLRLFYRLRTR